MDHESASQYLIEFVRDELSGENRTSVAAHVENCTECQGGIAAIQSLLRISPDEFEALLDDHPSADDLAAVAMSLGEDELETSELARLTAHARACPTCKVELQTARQSTSAVTGRAGIRRTLLRPIRMTPALPVALAATIVLMAIPLMRPNNQGPADLALPSILLTGQARSGSQTLKLTPDASHHLLLVEYSPALLASENPPDRFAVTLTRVAGQNVVWETQNAWNGLFNPESGVLALTVPTAALSPGAHQLQVDWGTGEADRTTVSLEITAP